MALTPISTHLNLLTQTSAVPLKTIFTPPWSCTNAVPGNVYYLEGGYPNVKTEWQFPAGCNPTPPAKWNPTSSNSYLPSTLTKAGFFVDFQLHKSRYYSPGVCPHKYNYVATSTAHDLQTGGPPITLAVCCPPHMSGWAGVSDIVCEQVLSASDTKGFFSSIFKHIHATSLPGMTVYAQPISVAWQSSDLSKFIPVSAPSIALAIQEGKTSIPEWEKKPAAGRQLGLEPNVAIGVGVAAGVAFCLLLGYLIHYFRARARRAMRERCAMCQKQPEGDPKAICGGCLRNVPPPYHPPAYGGPPPNN